LEIEISQALTQCGLVSTVLSVNIYHSTQHKCPGDVDFQIGGIFEGGNKILLSRDYTVNIIISAGRKAIRQV
jgi:hypothetical protein